MKKFLVLSVVLSIGASVASAESCPSASRGSPPNCICNNGAVYDASYNFCLTDLLELKGVCPDEAPGFFPNCNW